MASTSTPTTGYLSTSLPSPTHPITLRTIAPQDAPALAALLSDHRNMLFESPAPPQPMPLSTAELVIARMRDSAAAPSVLGPDGRPASGPGRVNLAVVYRGGGEEETMIGLSGFGSIKDLEEEEGAEGGGKRTVRMGDVGVMLDSAYRRRGHAAEAVRLSVEWGFRPVEEGGLQLDRVTAATLGENEPMVRLLTKKMGWEGTRRPAPEREGKEEVFFVVERPQ
ncbi:hypothetical protein NKR23_g9855 [Pleurostoma richardsiae]|uniref:N-acetyltransferase domain-containing protein n=1 Tax=Pleurostoma richardsiae TaxID=41990 RepID=A0AA38RGB7_9PEZI|nr:hypothetical protein NKR23_g9855 [Pleurostoma richardsiae]